MKTVLAYVLVASVGKDNDWKTAEGWDDACPLSHANFPSILHGVSLDKMVDYQDNEVTNRDQRNDTSVFE